MNNLHRFLTPLTALSGILTTGVASASLVAWYPLDSDALDASGNGHHGAVVGGTVNFGQAGANANTVSSAAFPDNGHITVPYSAALNSSTFTVTMWVNTTSTAGFTSPLTSRDDVPNPGGSTHGYILYNDVGGNWNFWNGTGAGSGTWDQLVGGGVSINTWTHIAMTYDGGTSTKTIWINGVNAGSKTVGHSVNGPQTEDLHIGSGSDAGTNFYFSGNIDDVTIWDEALDQAAIQSIMIDSVPEPTSTLLLGLGLISVAFRRNR
ncbi:hypothetical protein NT6N_30060 [Oceaniferula spumae]|uniref:Ice-binding protein C-terminal domain-containing protein n=1 Tax=Oceaniferula spumae TaxID=2979115 RepID=A0AAT9FPZ5_9BACT